MKLLPSVLLVCVDTINYGKAVAAIQKSLKQIMPYKAIFLTDIPYKSDQFEVIQIPTIKTIEEYSHFMLKELWKYIRYEEATHVLVIQHDGYVLDGEQWDDEFLSYSFLGAPWPRQDKYQIGNGGFSLRSMTLIERVANDDTIMSLNPEDNVVAILYRDYLESKGFAWPPIELAHKFSFELYQPRCKTFGFHNYHHEPFKPYVVLRRAGALGDVVQLEPVLHWYHEHGFNVVLDSPCWPLFEFHYFPVIPFERFDQVIPHKVINLDMAYETKPDRLHLMSYYEICGIMDGELRNPRLNYKVTPGTKLFKKYVVIHIDRRETTHRNVYGIEWKKVVDALESRGYSVIQIGHGDHEEVGTWINTLSIQMMMWVIKGADLLIAVDSGPSNIAVALGVPSIIFFGSVDPKILYADTKAFHILQSGCPFGKPNCWSLSPGTRGQDCDKPEEPPCCVHDTEKLIQLINFQL